MSTDNLKFRKPHMTFIDGYFYMFDDDTDMLLQKTDDGLTAFSYPFDTLLTETISSIEYDGINFWSMEDGDSSDTVVIRRWRIENYTCKLQGTPITLSDPTHKFDSEAFTVEHYHCTVSGGYVPGDTTITLQSDIIPGDLSSEMTVTIGPNVNGEHETYNVQSTINNTITLANPLLYTYTEGDPLIFYNYIWLFNNADELDTDTGALYKINAYGSGSIVSKTSGGIYKDVKATTFSEISHFTSIGIVNSLMYVKASNLFFVDISTSTLDYYGSMAMDTIEGDDTTIIEVYDLSVYDKNLYRLQLKATYFGVTTDFSNYSYQAATFESMVASIGLSAVPNVIAANTISVSYITAKVRDQFLNPIINHEVYFSVDGTGSIVSGQESMFTNTEGNATSAYRSGDVAELVNVLARVDQT